MKKYLPEVIVVTALFVLAVLIVKPSHQKYFYIRCVDANGHLTYEAKSTEYPVSNMLKGLGVCEYVYR